MTIHIINLDHENSQIRQAQSCIQVTGLPVEVAFETTIGRSHVKQQ